MYQSSRPLHNLEAVSLWVASILCLFTISFLRLHRRPRDDVTAKAAQLSCVEFSWSYGCSTLIADATASVGASLEMELLAHDQPAALLLISQVDGAQLESVAILQLL